ncbi:Disease resistance protein (TIR-NBS-LRR class) [Quillaja saponaria]|uniref:Disease resistance protein (TIR-NBS-LRR class) n=1 Tax=Quillaja saponaria TaxID=32244 RepID=A0AAD7LPK4_QUISA|nr:Disease resistance protein (TIR-NBS-LRR class) [Quillaja saponaria]
MNKLSKWKAALTEAASLSGCHSINFMSEPTLTDKLVQDILLKLNRLSLSEFNFKDLVGIKRPTKKVEPFLQTGSSKVRTLGIWGMPGIGKITIAEAVFTKLSSQFNHRYFVPNVREQVEKSGLTLVRDKYFSALLEQAGPHIVRHNFERERLSRKNALVVFDDVDKSIQLETFTGSLLNEYLDSRSRVIVTSNDRQVLENVADSIYDVTKMCFPDSLCLFSSVNVGFVRTGDLERWSPCVQAGDLTRWSPPCVRVRDLQGWSWRPVNSLKLKSVSREIRGEL